jgi:multicomponent K+:H+ antiporter subunit E
MTRWLPHPVASLVLMAIWLLLNQSASHGQALLGAAFGLLGPLLYRQLDIPSARLRRPVAAARLAAAFVADVLRSNLNVARVILRGDPAHRPGFVHIPLRLRSPYGLAALACIITATPGTSWVSYDPASGGLLIHVLDLSDDDDWGKIIQERYERLLMEIFE